MWIMITLSIKNGHCKVVEGSSGWRTLYVDGVQSPFIMREKGLYLLCIDVKYAITSCNGDASWVFLGGASINEIGKPW